MDPLELRVIGRFVPSAYQSEIIETEFARLECLPLCCRRERMSVRIPHERAVEPHPDNLEWHQDGGGSEGTTHHMIVWANELPTELKTADGTLFTAEPFEVVWYDNTRCFHRQPRNTDRTTRWFMAVRCSGALA